MLQTLIVYTVLTALSARQLLESGVKPFGPLVHTPSSEQVQPVEINHQLSDQTTEQAASVKVADERKEDVSSKQERKKNR